MIVDQSIRDLHIILVTERCDMSYVISYFTQENVFIVAEIVFQSSCNNPAKSSKHWIIAGLLTQDKNPIIFTKFKIQ